MKLSIIKSFITDYPHYPLSDVSKILGVSRTTVYKAVDHASILNNIDWELYHAMDCSVNAKGLYFFLTDHFNYQLTDNDEVPHGNWYTSHTNKQLADATGLSRSSIQRALKELVGKYLKRRPQLTDSIHNHSTQGNGSYHYLPLDLPLTIGMVMVMKDDRQEVSKQYKDAHKHRRVVGSKQRNLWKKY